MYSTKRFYSPQKTVARMFQKRLPNLPLGRFLLTCLVGLAFAATVGQSDGLASEALTGVLYEPSSGSYFELHRVKDGFGKTRWRDVNKFVEGRLYKGIRGRLAVIKTRQTHEFVRKNFRFRLPTWIGLRYMCSNRSLVWVTGERVNRGSDFQIWDRSWIRTPNMNCDDRAIDYMAVHYTTNPGHPTWQASGPNRKSVV